VLGFNQHKIAVTICRKKEQCQEHVIATTKLYEGRGLMALSDYEVL